MRDRGPIGDPSGEGKSFNDKVELQRLCDENGFFIIRDITYRDPTHSQRRYPWKAQTTIQVGSSRFTIEINETRRKIQEAITRKTLNVLKGPKVDDLDIEGIDYVREVSKLAKDNGFDEPEFRIEKTRPHGKDLTHCVIPPMESKGLTPFIGTGDSEDEARNTAARKLFKAITNRLQQKEGNKHR